MAQPAALQPARRPPRRAGASALDIFAASLDARILLVLGDGARPLRELRLAAGAPPQTTLRKRLAGLAEAGLIERRRLDAFPGTQQVALTSAGRELMPVAQTVGVWLARCPDGPIELGTMASRAALRALTDGWSSLIVRALAARPLSLTELDRLITAFNYPSLERRFDALRVIGLIRPESERARATPYAVTDWLRSAVAPLAAAARWERGAAPGAAPIGRRDVEAAMLLAAPILRLGSRTTGRCQVTVGSDGERAVGAVLSWECGRPTACETEGGGKYTGSIGGTVEDWFAAAFDGLVDRLKVDGDRTLTREVLSALSSMGEGVH